MRRRVATSPTGRPRISARPAVGKISCMSSFSVVVLPAPFGPEEPEHFPGLDAERQTVQRTVPAPPREADGVILGELFDLNRWRHYLARLSSMSMSASIYGAAGSPSPWPFGARPAIMRPFR